MQERLERYDYLPEEQLPALVLAINEHPDYPRDYVFTEPGAWRRISHQTAGYRCNQHYMHARILEPMPTMRELMQQIAQRYDDSCLGQWSVSLDEVLEYRALLLPLGLDCDLSYTALEEGIYPLDCSAEIVRKVSAFAAPDDLDTLIEWGEDPSQLFGSIGRWKLYVLTENCD